MALFTNSATLSYNGTVATSNLVQGELLGVLRLTKTAVRPAYRPGDRLTYVITLTNSGPVPLTGLTLTDDLGAYEAEGFSPVPLTFEEGAVLYYENGVLTSAPAAEAGPPLVFTGISVPASGFSMLIYEVTVNRFAPPAVGGTIVNTVTAEGTGLSSPVTAAGTVSAEESAVLSVSKSLSPAVISENGVLTYSFLIRNTGNMPADESGDAVLTDLFNPVLKDITVSFNGTAWSEGTDYTYDASTGLFNTVPGQITVPAATFVRDSADGSFLTSAGESELVITGTV